MLNRSINAFIYVYVSNIPTLPDWLCGLLFWGLVGRGFSLLDWISIETKHNRFSVDIDLDGVISKCMNDSDDMYRYNDHIIHGIDYLRSKGYDCGHGNIPSLISAGIAVEK